MVFIATGCGLVWYFEHEKERMQKKRIAEANKTIGKPKLGGSFKLVDHNGNPFTEADMKGRYSLVRNASATASVLVVADKRIVRSTLASPIAPTSAPRSSTKWPTCTTSSRNSCRAP